MRIAIAKTGNMLNPDLNYVEITSGAQLCPACGEPIDAVFIAVVLGAVVLLSVCGGAVQSQGPRKRVTRTRDSAQSATTLDETFPTVR